MKNAQYITKSDLAELGTVLDAKIEKLAEEITVKVTAIVLDVLIPQIAEMFEAQNQYFDARLDKLESRMEGLESRMDKLESRMDKLESRMDELEFRMDGLESTMNKLTAEQKQLKEVLLDNVEISKNQEVRIGKLEVTAAKHQLA